MRSGFGASTSDAGLLDIRPSALHRSAICAAGCLRPPLAASNLQQVGVKRFQVHRVHLPEPNGADVRSNVLRDDGVVAACRRWSQPLFGLFKPLWVSADNRPLAGGLGAEGYCSGHADRLEWRSSGIRPHRLGAIKRTARWGRRYPE